MLTVIGLPIATQGKPRFDDKSQKIFISNHITNFDPFILMLLHPNILVCYSHLYKFLYYDNDYNENCLFSFSKLKLKNGLK